MKKDKSMCSGCRDDFYNHAGPHGSKKCWSYEKARVVKRWRIGWWTSPVQPRAFQQVRMLSCYHKPGEVGHCEELPSRAVEPVYLSKGD